MRLVLLLLALFAQEPGVAVRPVVDHHQHLFSPAITALSSRPRPVVASDLVAQLDEAGIERALVLSLAYQYGNPNRPPVDDEYQKVKAENDWTSQQVAQYSKRLRAFCALNPLKPYALDEIERCAKDPHLRLGLKLHFGNSDVDLANRDHVVRLRQVVAAANRHGMAILAHMRASVTLKRPHGADRARVMLDEILPAAPDVPFVIAHLTGAGSFEEPGTPDALAVFADAIEKRDPRMARVYFDVSGVAGLGPWRDRAPRIAANIRRLGIERILYGSDAAGPPNGTPAMMWASFRELPLTEQEIAAVAVNVAPFMK
jgi:predicted TIM-barrel fold metal-dependent hydrolase